VATVGVVGLGLLGGAVASRLLGAGHAVVGFDVARERVAALEARGGKGAESAVAVARAAEAVFTLLPSLASVEDVVLGPAGLITVGLGSSLDDAARQAIAGMLDFLQEAFGLKRAEARVLASLVVTLRVTQVVNRTVGVHAVLPPDAFTVKRPSAP